jgi:hypothetical protein
MAGWTIVRTKPLGKTHGLALPAFIRNGDHHLIGLDVYADGVVDCWGCVDLPLFRRKVAEGWVATRPPAGAGVFIYNLGRVRVAAAEWALSPQDLVGQVERAVGELNPEQAGLVDLQGEESEVRGNGVRYARLGLTDEKPYRLAGRKEVLGAEVPVVLREGEDYRLTRWFVFADGQTQLGYGPALTPLDEVAALFDAGRLTTAVPEGAWVAIDGLGRFRAGEGHWGVRPRERVREAHDLVHTLTGSTGAVRRCIDRHREYRQEPSPERRELLRQAYEAVPDHLRRYCGDMDSKDGPIRRILERDG